MAEALTTTKKDTDALLVVLDDTRTALVQMQDAVAPLTARLDQLTAALEHQHTIPLEPLLRSLEVLQRQIETLDRTPPPEVLHARQAAPWYKKGSLWVIIAILGMNLIGLYWPTNQQQMVEMAVQATIQQLYKRQQAEKGKK